MSVKLVNDIVSDIHLSAMNDGEMFVKNSVPISEHMRVRILKTGELIKVV